MILARVSLKQGYIGFAAQGIPEFALTIENVLSMFERLW
jgi:hypothetical protein